jgi:formylglycine-generating enzyme
MESLARLEPRLSGGMVALPGGPFCMGSDHHYPEEAPVRVVAVSPFLIDATPVTNAAFAAFVAATGHVTLAERSPAAADYPGLLPEMAKPGSLVFRAALAGFASLGPDSWWDYCFDADWRHPWGPDSDLSGLADHPVVHVAWADARAFAAWAGKRLPSEAEAEYAARGGLDGATYAWGEEFEPGGQVMANIWRGAFPFANPERPGPPFTTAVGHYPPNGHGLFDTIGNVWEWTASDADGEAGANGCCGQRKAGAPIPRKVLKGGSHLCAPSYCRRYRPAARWFQPIDTSTSHVGFRCARSLEAA